MNAIIPTPSTLLPLPQANIATRPATLADLPFIDGLQKKYSKQLGFFPRAQMEGYINNGWVMVAEEAGGGQQASGGEETGSSVCSASSPPALLGYCASRDRYLKRDELGAIFQLCVTPGSQRKLIGANLLRATFEASPYGCKLYCCWCAQDLEANAFWESMGFVPLAFRTGSEKKARTHIFWQKRIRGGDATTPWWFPSQTTGGSIREDRLVLPIPPGTHWRDVKPLVLPGAEAPAAQKQLPSPTRTPAKKKQTTIPQQYGPPSATMEPAPVAKQPKPKPPKRKNDPKLVTAARELRDRWLEELNTTPLIGQGKYEIARAIGDTVTIEAMPMKRLAA